MIEPMTTGYNPARGGCTFPDCRSQDTVTLCGRFGRRCAEHPAPFDRAWALTLVDLGRPSEAFAYLRTYLAGRAAA